MWDITSRSVVALVSLPVRLYELAVTLVTNGERDPNGPVSVVGVSRLGGEVVAAAEEPVASRASAVLLLAASLNLFLFLFNLVPILPLDGGHVAGALYEGARRRVARLRGRPDPGPGRPHPGAPRGLRGRRRPHRDERHRDLGRRVQADLRSAEARARAGDDARGGRPGDTGPTPTSTDARHT